MSIDGEANEASFPSGGPTAPLPPLGNVLAPPAKAPSLDKALILSLLGLFCCGPVAIAGLLFARKAREEIRTSGGQFTGETRAIVSEAIAWAAIGIWGIVIFAALISGLSDNRSVTKTKTPSRGATERSDAAPREISPKDELTETVVLRIDQESIPETSSAPNIRVTGQVEIGAELTITVNGSSARIEAGEDGRFAHEVTLSVGNNVLIFAATKPGKKPATKTIAAKYTPPPSPSPPSPTPPPPAVDIGSGSSDTVYYKNCDEARRAGAAPIYKGEPGYRPELDRDKDGVACE